MLLPFPGKPVRRINRPAEWLAAPPQHKNKRLAMSSGRKREMERANIRDTLAEGATRIAEEASIRRTDLLMQPSFDAVALCVDAADCIGAANSLEKMLAHPMAVAHEASLRLMDRALATRPADGRCWRATP